MAILNKEEAIAKLSEIVSKALAHKYYLATIAHAKLCRQLVTGVGINELLESFTPREDPLLLVQRTLITHAITPAVSERVMSHFYHVGRLDSVTKKVSYDAKVANFEARIAEIANRAESFFGEDSVDDYLSLRLVDLNFLDPNAFMLVDFKKFDSTFEKARPYPIEVPSENAFNYCLTNNKIDWLVTRFPIKVKSRLPDGKPFDGYQYTMYCQNEAYRFTRVDSFAPEVPEELRLIAGVNGVGHNYVLSIYNHKAGEVQGFRVGYKRDLTTNGETFVSPMNGAMCHFMASIQTVSLFDLSKFLHVFPQKIQYVDDCPGPAGEDAPPCRRGELPDGSTCPVCNGTGLEKVHTSAQDAIFLRKPKNPDDYIDLEKLLVYKSPPIEVLTFQRDEVERLEAKILTTVFNAENLVQTTVSKTATEVSLSADSRYNTLFPFSKLYSRAWIKCYKLIALFTDNGEGLILQHNFPNDFKLRTLGELLATLKAANDSSAPSVMKQRLALEIAQKELADDTLGLLRYQTQVAFTPFQGKSDEQVQYIISNGLCRLEDRILWTHSDTIFDEFEWNQPEFFSLTRKQQSPLVMKAVKTIAEGMPSGNAFDFRDAVPTDENEPGTGAEDVTDQELRNTVGGAALILTVQQSVSKGITTYEAGLSMLTITFKYTEDEAKKLLGDPIDLSDQVTNQDLTV
jgi:hypothetical protein